MGAAPFLGGGFGHFFTYAPIKIEYAIDRYAMEAKRQLDVLDKRLADHPFVAGDEYSLADIAIWPWYGGLSLGTIYNGAAEFLQVNEYTHLRRWAETIYACPAVDGPQGQPDFRRPGEPAPRAALCGRLPHQDPGQTAVVSEASLPPPQKLCWIPMATKRLLSLVPPISPAV